MRPYGTEGESSSLGCVWPWQLSCRALPLAGLCWGVTGGMLTLGLRMWPDQDIPRVWIAMNCKQQERKSAHKFYLEELLSVQLIGARVSQLEVLRAHTDL